jgi:8-hydroxy-5-deazaflavin:NADPH oxidoreductase
MDPPSVEAHTHTMKIAILGTGVVGQTLAHKLASLGHEVRIGTRNAEQTLARSDKDAFGRPPFRDWHAQNPGVGLTTHAEAAVFAELLVNATSGAGTPAALERAGKQNLAGKVLLDISNPLDFSGGFPPSLSVSNTDSLAEQIQRALPDTRVVKALNTMAADLMVNPRLLPGEHNVFVSGNDADAKAQVRRLLESFGWKPGEVIDLGDITTARGTEQMLPIWTRLLGVLPSPMFNFKIVVGAAPAA